MEPKKIVKKCEEGICPLCGSGILYDGYVGQGMNYPWTCPNCGAAGEEGYEEDPVTKKRSFNGYHSFVYDKDGNPVDIISPEEAESEVSAAVAQSKQPDMDSTPRQVAAECREGRCPLCGGELNYLGRDDGDEGGTYPWVCSRCGANGEEGFDRVFDGNHYCVHDAEGNAVKLIDPPIQIEMLKGKELLCTANNAIYNSAFQALNFLTNDELEWDVNIIAEATDALEAILEKRGFSVCHPWEDEEENICYSTPDRCQGCPYAEEVAE